MGCCDHYHNDGAVFFLFQRSSLSCSQVHGYINFIRILVQTSPLVCSFLQFIFDSGGEYLPDGAKLASSSIAEKQTSQSLVSIQRKTSGVCVHVRVCVCGGTSVYVCVCVCLCAPCSCVCISVFSGRKSTCYINTKTHNSPLMLAYVLCKEHWQQL